MKGIQVTNKTYRSALPLQFDPEQGEVVLEPEHAGSGYWVGAPSVLWDAAAGCWWLTYRRRRPRGVNPDGLGERGYVGRVARSEDGLHFEDVWEVVQGDWNTPSMERFCLARLGGGYALYVSYVDPFDNRWRIDVLTADDPARFAAQTLQPVFTAGAVGAATGVPVEGVKDPAVFRAGDGYYMVISYALAAARAEHEQARMHATADIYNTGLATAPTALATSADGLHWTWQGQILPTGGAGSWDCYQSRLNSAVPVGGLWLGFYDGAASERENYEEHCGVATSLDLRRWTKLTPNGPFVESPYGTRSLRYVEAIRKDDNLVLFYEYVRPDAAHELRRIVLPL
ncbi:MAG: hypothetical protein M1118_01680 [Chloroflexi bacterium]|nr:hypothetical protein [Chloroflexota bacterium]